MKQYIGKNKVEEILRNLWKKDDGHNAEHRICYNKALQDVQCELDSIEAKEFNLENSMICKVGWYDGFLLDYTQGQQDELLEKIGANVGDKIRVILIKE